MADTKCSFIGSATLSENVDALAAPAGMLPVLGEATDRVLHETLRDFASAQAFRRDLYRRGLSPRSRERAADDAGRTDDRADGQAPLSR